MAQLGKGCYIWKITHCENGNPSEIALVAKNAGFTHVLIKIADGTAAYHGICGRDEDLISPVVVALHGAGIQVYGWHYCYGDNPAGEADLAARRITYLKLDGYVIDAEQEYKADGKRAAAKYFMNRLKSNIPDVPVALSSYRFPSLHPQFPWSEFLDGCDFNMPQVYWVKAHNPAEQLIRTIREFQKISPSRNT